jgi:hypothetical protein
VVIEGCLFHRFNPSGAANAATITVSATTQSVFSGNVFKECGPAPIYASGAVQHSVFQGNTFQNSAIGAIVTAGMDIAQANSDDNSFIGNTFDFNVASRGISIGGNTGWCLIGNSGTNARIDRTGANDNTGFDPAGGGPNVVDLNNVNSYT